MYIPKTRLACYRGRSRGRFPKSLLLMRSIVEYKMASQLYVFTGQIKVYVRVSRIVALGSPICKSSSHRVGYSTSATLFSFLCTGLFHTHRLKGGCSAARSILFQRHAACAVTSRTMLHAYSDFKPGVHRVPMPVACDGAIQ